MYTKYRRILAETKPQTTTHAFRARYYFVIPLKIKEIYKYIFFIYKHNIRKTCSIMITE